MALGDSFTFAESLDDLSYHVTHHLQHGFQMRDSSIRTFKHEIMVINHFT